MVTKVN